MCRGVAWLEPTAMVTPGGKCQRLAHGLLLFQMLGNCFAISGSEAPLPALQPVGKETAEPFFSKMHNFY